MSSSEIERIEMVTVLKPIIAGIDDSPDGAWAGAVAWRIGETAGTRCLLVHAVRDVVVPPGGIPGMADESQLRSAILRMARERILDRLRGNVPDESLASVDVRVGVAARVLAEVAAERDAGLIVVGGKKHRALGRWLGGSTVHQTARVATVPLLITTDSAAKIDRVLAAVDLSVAATDVIEVAERYARLFGANLRIMHTIEEVPFALEYPALVDPEALTGRVSEILEESIWPTVTDPKTERVVRHGAPNPTIEAEVHRWGAHLVVLGSHGKGWIDRLLLGSVTERLINALPTSLLVVPVRDQRGT